jgi:hypothetical protein
MNVWTALVIIAAIAAGSLLLLPVVLVAAVALVDRHERRMLKAETRAAADALAISRIRGGR